MRRSQRKRFNAWRGRRLWLEKLELRLALCSDHMPTLEAHSGHLPEIVIEATAESEPNDTFATADVGITAADNLTGTLASASDVDFFVVTLQVNDVLHVHSDHTGIAYEPGVTIVDSQGNIRAETLNGLNVRFVAPTAGDYGIRISAPNVFGSFTGSYDVEIETVAATSLAEVEPNDTSVAATSLGSAIVFRGALASAADVDYFSFAANAGDDLALHWNQAPHLNPTLRLYDAGGALLKASLDGAGFHYAFSSSGTYRFAVGSDNAAGTVLGGYIGSYMRVQASLNDAEPNNDLTTAQPWTITTSTTTIAGDLAALSDVDVYQVSLEAGARYAFDFTTAPGAILTAGRRLSLYNSNGQLVASTFSTSLSINSTSAYNANIERTGTYYLAIAATSEPGVGGYLFRGRKSSNFSAQRDIPLFYHDYTGQTQHLSYGPGAALVTQTAVPLLMGLFEARYDVFDVDTTQTPPDAGVEHVNFGMGEFGSVGAYGWGGGSAGTRRPSGGSMVDDAGNWASLNAMNGAASVMNHETGHAVGLPHARSPVGYMGYDNQNGYNPWGQFFPFLQSDSRVPASVVENERSYLDLALQAGRVGMEAEGNDSFLTAQDLAPWLTEMGGDGTTRNDRVTVLATIDSAVDADFYSFTALAGQGFALDIDAAEFQQPVDALLELYNSTGTLLATSDDALDLESGLQSLDPYLVRTFATAGEYHLKVTAKRGSVGGYRLKLTPAEAFDTQGPRVLAAWPNGGSTINSTSQLMFWLNDKLDPTTVHGANVSVIGNTVGARSGSAYFDPIDSTLTWLGDSPLPNDTYTVTFASGVTGIKDLRGNFLDGESGGSLVWPAISGNGTPGGNFTTSFTVNAQDSTPATNSSGSYRQHPYNRGLFTLNFSDELDVASIHSATWTLRGAGPDNVLGNVDDTLAPLDPLYDRIDAARTSGSWRVYLYSRGIPDAGNYRIEGAVKDATGAAVRVSRIITVTAAPPANTPAHGPSVIALNFQSNTALHSAPSLFLGPHAIEVTFSGNINLTTLTTANFKVRYSPDANFFDANDVYLVDADNLIEWEPTFHRATFQPAGPMLGGYYLLELEGDAGGIRDVAGQLLDGEYLDSNIAGNTLPQFWRNAPSGDGLPGGDYRANFVIDAFNTAPTISNISNTEIPFNTATAALPFTVGDAESAVGALVITFASSNETLIPLTGLALGGSGANRTLTVTPAANLSGTATITVTVTDPAGASALEVFQITVFAAPAVVNHSPTSVAAAALGSIDFHFDRPMDPLSFVAGEDIVSFTGPLGNLLLQISGTSWVDSDTLRISFADQLRDGNYTLTLGPNIKAATGGLFIDQDGDGTPGEAVEDRYVANVTLDRSLGPDGGGYTATATTFENIDLSAGDNGVTVALDSTEDGTASINLGANTFRFYGNPHSGTSSLRISANGLITFGSASQEWQNTDLTSIVTQAAIAPLWDDWQTQIGVLDQVLTKFEDLTGDGISDRLIIEWSAVTQYNNQGNPVTFQAILELNTGARNGDIIFNYPQLDTGLAQYTNGASATVGIKDSGTQGANRLLISHNSGTSPFVASGRAIRLESNPPTADIVDIFSDPRNTPVGIVNVQFSENVTGVDLGDFVLTRNGVAVALTGVVSGSGANYSLDLTAVTALAGDYVLTLKADSNIRDWSDIPLVVSASDAWTIDLAAPPAPVLVGLDSDSGASASDRITNDGTLLFQGTAEAFSLVQVTRSGVGVIGTAQANGSGVWSFDYTGVTLAEGNHAFSAIATDAAGNAGAALNWSVTIDNTAPAVSEIAPSVATITGSHLGTDKFTLTATFDEPMDPLTVPVFSFPNIAENPNDTVVLASGEWTTNNTRFVAHFNVLDADRLLTGVDVRVTGGKDVAGNAHGSTNQNNVFGINTQNPTADILDIAPDPRNTAVNVAAITFSGNVSGVDITDFKLTRNAADVSLEGLTVAGSAGNYTLDLSTKAALPGSYVLTLVAAGSGIQDSIGNPLVTDVSDTWTIDLTPPSAEIVDIAADPRNTAVGQVSLNFTEPVTGLDIGDFQLTRNGQDVSLAGIQIVGSEADYSLNLASVTSGEGDYLLTLTATNANIRDLAGNALSSGASDAWRMDLTAPTVNLLAISPDPRNSAVGNVTFAFSEAVTGFELADLALTRDGAPISLGGLALTVNGNAYSIDLSTVTALAGDYVLTLAGVGSGIADLAGNALASGASDAWKTDLTAPVRPVLTSIADDTGSSATDRITFDQTLLFEGTVEAGSAVRISRAGTGVIGTVAANAQGQWSLDYTSIVLAEGDYAFSAVAIDGAQNESPTLPWTVTVDRTAPMLVSVVPSVSVITDEQAGGSFTLSLIYSEAMDPAFVPAITLEVAVPVTGSLPDTLTPVSTTWLNATTYVATFDVDDANQAFTVSRLVSGGVDLAGNSVQGSSGNPAAFRVNTLNPFATFQANFVSPTVDPAGRIDIGFNTDVAGFEADDLSLTRNGEPVIGLLLEGSGAGYFTNLASLTTTPGDYVLKLTAVGSGIVDADGNPLVSDTEFAWTLDLTPPTAEIQNVVPDPRNTPVGNVEIVFSEVVSELQWSAFELTRDGAPVSLIGLDPTFIDGVRYTLDLSSVTSLPGSYALTLITGPGVHDVAGNLLAGDVTESWVIDTAGPTVSIGDVTPDPRAGNPEVVAINFSEPVTGFGVEDLMLTLDGEPVVLPAAWLSGDGQNFALGMAGLAGLGGSYVLALTSAGIRDMAGNSMALGAAETWTTDTTRPTAGLVNVTPDPRNHAVGLVTIQFSEPVTGVDISDFELRRDGTIIDLTGTGFTGSGVEYTLDLSAVTLAPGAYTLKLVAAASNIQDAVGNLMLADATDTWQTVAAQLQLSVEPGPIVENGGTVSVTVTRTDFDQTAALVVTLQSDQLGTMTVPANVVIPANEASVTFLATLVDDSIVDGPQAVTLTVTAGGHVNGSLVLDVTDDESATPLKNPTEPYDVEGDGDVDVQDAIAVVRWLRKLRGGATSLPTQGPPWLDTNGDRVVAIDDAIMVIRELRRRRAGGEGEVSPSPTATVAVAALAPMVDTTWLAVLATDVAGANAKKKSLAEANAPRPVAAG